MGVDAVLTDLALAVPDIDVLVQSFSRGGRSSEARIVDLLRLRQFLHRLDQVAVLVPPSTIALQRLKTTISDPELGQVLAMIEETLSDSPATGTGPLARRFEVCYAVRSGINGMLDMARATYKESIDDAVALSATLSESSGRAVDLQWVSQAEHFVFVSAKAVAGAMNIRRRGNRQQFMTATLQRQNMRIRSSFADAAALSRDTIDALTRRVLERLACLLKAADALATLDFLTTLASHAHSARWIQPEVGIALAIRQGRHPILEHIDIHRTMANDATLLRGQLQFVT